MEPRNKNGINSFELIFTIPGEYHVNVTLIRGKNQSANCYLKGDEFSVDGKEMRFELVRMKAMFDSSPARKNLPQKNEVILIYIDDQPTHFVQVEEIKKADKFGYYRPRYFGP
jgi:hypothetical protein